MPQNATPLRKSAPWPPNISDEHVSCTAPATRNSSLQILFNAPRLPTLLKVLQTPHVLLTFGKVHHAKRHLTFKSCANMWCFVHFDIDMCFAPQRCARFRHLNFQKCSENGVLVHFDFDKCFVPRRRAIFHLSLARWLRTCRFSKPTFQPSGAIGKTCFCAPASSFL